MEYLYLSYDRDRHRHISRTGGIWTERVLLINRDGFSKDWEVHPEDRYAQHLRSVHIDKIQHECSVMEVMIFLRTNEKAPDGRAIFREDSGL
jgi:hypothetical protein